MTVEEKCSEACPVPLLKTWKSSSWVSRWICTSLAAAEKELAVRATSCSWFSYLPVPQLHLPVSPQLWRRHTTPLLYPGPRIMTLSDKSWRPVWTAINVCSPNSLWLHFYPNSSQHFCSEKGKHSLSLPNLLRCPWPQFFPPASGSLFHQFPLLFPIIPSHGPFSHLTNLLLAPCPKSKQNQIEDKTILSPVLLPKATVSFFPDTNKMFLFPPLILLIWWRWNLLSHHFHVCVSCPC